MDGSEGYCFLILEDWYLEFLSTMHINIFSFESFPKGMAATKHISNIAYGLSKAGASVDLLIYHRAVDRQNDDGLPAEGEYNGIKYKYIIGKYKPENKAYRAINTLYLEKIKWFVWLLKNICKDDILYCYNVNFWNSAFIILASKIKGFKVVREITEYPFYNNTSWDKVRRSIANKFILTHFDAFVCISHPLCEYVENIIKEKNRILLLPILVNEEDIFEGQSPYNSPYIIHTGTMYERKDGISYILKAFSEFKKKNKSDCKLVFAGPQSNERCEYLPLIKSLGLDNDVVLAGMITDNDLLARLQHFAAASIVYRFENIQTHFGFSTKMGEILIAGIPLITTNIGEQKFYLKDKVNSLLVDPGDVGQLKSAIEFVLNNPEESRIIGENAHKLAVEEFNYLIHGKRLFSFIETQFPDKQ